MPKSTLVWNPDEYATVRERVELFRAAHPTGRIVTELVSRTRARVTFRALVYRSVAEAEPAATGWASEREGDGEVNTVACLENAETSAVGRALANLGFSGSRARPGRDEMSHAARRANPSTSAPAVPHAELALVREAPRKPAADQASLEGEADALLDALLLLEAAERAGLAPARVRALRRGLTARSVAPSTRQRAERELREWLLHRREGPTAPAP